MKMTRMNRHVLPRATVLSSSSGCGHFLFVDMFNAGRFTRVYTQGRVREYTVWSRSLNSWHGQRGPLSAEG